MVVVRCTRVVELPDPSPVDAEVRQCLRCHADIWLEKTLPDLIRSRFPDKDYGAMCLQCSARLDTVPTITGDEQIRQMLDEGHPPIQVAHIVAVGYASGGLTSLEQADLEITLFPRGKRARTYIEGFDLAVQIIKRLQREQ